MLCPQPCTKIPPPPWEELVTVTPSMAEGLQRKLLGYGLAPFAPRPQPLVLLPLLLVLFVSSTVPAGKPPPSMALGLVWNGSEPGGNRMPLASTVIPAPSSAPISDGSCSSSARLPLWVASQPTTGSSGSRSICGLL